MRNREFMLGVATAAHQVEGNNIHSDYYTMELMKTTSFLEPSGDAVDHYHRFEEDIKLLAEAGLNTYRFSIEWARIEPAEGQFDEAEIEHYRKVLICCHENGIIPIVTLHHFTSPKWVISKGGWEDEAIVEYFRRYSVYVAEQLGDLMEYVCTINEANMGMQLSVIAKRYLRSLLFGKKKKTDGEVQVGVNLQTMLSNMKNAKQENLEVFGTEKLATFVSGRSKEGDLLIMRAHEVARDAMKAVCPKLRIGLSLSLHDIQALPGGEKRAEKEWQMEFLHYLPHIQNDDFIGIQNYTRELVNRFGVKHATEEVELTQMEYEFYPEALEHVIRRVAEKFSGELIVTENGIATNDDTRRVEFITRACQGVANCIKDDIPVVGYCHWSLLDNFEWQKGYSMHFGLVSVDRETQKRTAKPSLAHLGTLKELF